MEKEYQAVDISRFMMACLVIAIHMPPFLGVNSELNFWFENYVVRLAVPFFFMCTGFFVFGSIRMSDIVEKIVGLLKQYIFWTAVYTPFIYKL